MGAGPDSAPVVKIILRIDYFAPTNQREAWTGVGWTGVSAASVDIKLHYPKILNHALD